jgi:glycosyltransferase involved in cell wall biosynthesis
MRIINIIDSIDKVNYGIWNAAISTASYLNNEYQVTSELWFPQVDSPLPHIDDVALVPLESTSTKYINQLIKIHDLDKDSCIIVTHGCWQYATRWGSYFKNKGYPWHYVPHGMLEPWSREQKKTKKAIYFNLVEYRLSKKADVIRAVGKPEYENLKLKYRNLHLIPNGIEETINNDSHQKWNAPSCINYLFMARLHHKKGIVPLIKAWLNSPQAKTTHAHLYIAGPDDGELATIKQLLTKVNITYLGAVYGADKQVLLEDSHIYLLPSHSEGFPTSVLEAMYNHLVAVISDGCNFPEAIDGQYALQTDIEITGIEKSLNTIHQMSHNDLQLLSQKGANFIQCHYTLKHIAQKQFSLFQK